MNSETVYQYIAKIPGEKVSTYKLVAKACGIKNPRQVGNILHKNTSPKNYPCHRVVRSDGTLAGGYAFGGLDVQKQLLENEGIEFKNGKINLNQFLYNN
jgi:methylated-DNA-protein-cysteine methyltransferase-like protein